MGSEPRDAPPALRSLLRSLSLLFGTPSQHKIEWAVTACGLNHPRSVSPYFKLILIESYSFDFHLLLNELQLPSLELTSFSVLIIDYYIMLTNASRPATLHIKCRAMPAVRSLHAPILGYAKRRLC